MNTSSPIPSTASDIRTEAWIIRAAPMALRPYLKLIRADRPIGTWLLLIPCLWSLTLAAYMAGPVPPSLWAIGLFAVGAFVMRSAGCVVNDLWDRKIDAQVARTADRPIASGEISVRQALMFLALLLAIGLAVLLQFNTFAVALGVASLVLVGTYPLMKRVTYWPQAFLGLTFNWGALMGFAVILGDLPPEAYILFAGCFFWTLGYDTVYGHQDKADDIVVGVKSSSIKLGEKTKLAVTVFYVFALVLFGATIYLVGLDWVAYAGLAGMALQMGWQVSTLDIDDPANCLHRFKSNKNAGFVLLLGLLLG